MNPLLGTQRGAGRLPGRFATPYTRAEQGNETGTAASGLRWRRCCCLRGLKRRHTRKKTHQHAREPKMSFEGLSVGIPAYNQGAFLGRTIESLLRQTRPPDEIVVSDHFSTDDTAKVAKSFAGRIRYVQPPPGTTYSGQFNFTLRQLRSPWITMLSSDDVAYPNYVEVLLRGAKRSPNAVLVRGAWNDIDAEDKVLTTHFLFSVKPVTRPPRTLTEQRHSPKGGFASFAIRREACERAGWGPEENESINDWPLFVRMAPFGDFIYESEVIAGYRIGHDGDKYRRRLPLWLRDEQRMFSGFFPEAAARLKMRDTKWIKAASRRNFLRYLCEASQRFAPEGRAILIEPFETWAASVGEEERMRRFKNGEVLPTPLWLGERLRAKVRPIYARLKQ
jgi:glycosyltransferase involved in cell wall biosynthesis